MIRIHLIAVLLLASIGQAAEIKPLRALLIAGGCCHDYAKQHEVISKGIQSRANVQVDVIWTDDKSTNPPLPLYDKPDWAKGYDIIIHDECAASQNNKEVLTRILDAHKTIPAVHLHCAMHSFRTGEDRWFKHLGLQSNSHGPQEPISITFVDKEHPITKPLADWTTIKEELYNNVTLFDAHPLAMGKQMVKGKPVDAVVAWTNEKAGARSFSTTIGHNTETVANARYIELVTRGVLWACDKLTDDYLKPFSGKNTTTFVKATPPTIQNPQSKTQNGVKTTASSQESGKGNLAWKAVDGDEGTRWCASSPEKPQWLQLELQKPEKITSVDIIWESKNNGYTHTIESSPDGKVWASFSPGGTAKFLKITCTATDHGGWASIREVKLKGPGIAALDPTDRTNQADLKYANQGNTPPKITKLTPAQEAAILADVKVPAGFDVTLFANSAAANYPVFLAAETDGTLYVSSDGNGSVQRNPKRGRVIRLRDLDNDGHADETKVFCEIDSPRGLVWDHDRLFLVHPPHLSEFIDADHDGVAEKQNILVKNIGWGFADRPADHATNGLSLGIDGWLYIAVGDFGFMKAEGKDGRTLQMRGGGVVRVRPDGTGLETYSSGTRNILEVAISPLMDMFARDNTNDGGGWNVRFHHFTGGDDHGYPRLYLNFQDECVPPLADYGGGSGTGAVYIDEPGFGEWNNAPFTCDWGTGALYHHQVKPKGATFEETRKPEPFIKMTRPTDADVDGMSRVYCASWKGATFGWEGPDVGYIVQVRPKGFKPEQLPDFAQASDEELVKALESASHRRRMEAQRELVRRPWGKAHEGILATLEDTQNTESSEHFVALLGVPLNHPNAKGEVMLDHGFGYEPWRLQWNVARSFDRYSKDGLELSWKPRFQGIGPEDPLEQGMWELANIRWSVLSGRADRLAERHCPLPQFVAHQLESLVVNGTRGLGDKAIDPWLAELDKEPSERGRRLALRCLQVLHLPEVTSGLITRLTAATDPTLRQGVLAALCRLHFKEGEWTGNSWGTRPDTRGPYYQPEAWSETPKIAAALKAALAKADATEAAFLVKEMNRNRIQFNEALQRILALAKQDEKVIPDAIAQLAVVEEVPAEAVGLLLKSVGSVGSVGSTTLSQAIIALAKTDSAEGVQASLAALNSLKPAQKDYEAASKAFFESPKLENHHQLVEQLAEKLDSTALYADAALLNLASRKTGSPESIQLTQKALDTGWANPKRRIQIIQAIALTKHQPSAAKILTSLDDPDPAVKAAAEAAAKAMRLKKVEDKTPKLASLKPEEALAAVLKEKGDRFLGEQVFTRATCVACHTTKESEAPKGPFLGNIAQTYKRPDLAQNILDPNKTIAQGFTSETVTLKDGTVQLGFITLEGANEIKIRNIAAQEFTYKTADIKSRQKLPISIMPPGLMANFTVKEFASLLDYLEALAKK